MKYTVKNEDGQLTFDSLTHLRQMYEQGMVSGDDQVQEGGGTVWRRADALPELRGVKARTEEARWTRWGLVMAVSLMAALYVLFHSHSVVIGLLVAGALMVPALVMSQRAFVETVKKRRP